MILRELYELYERLVAQGVDIPIRGRSLQKVSFRVVLRLDGALVRIEDVRERVKKPMKTKKGGEKKEHFDLEPVECMVLGGSESRTKGINPCFLCDNSAYLLGNVKTNKRALEYFDAAKAQHLAVEREINRPWFSAVCRFLESWDPARCSEEEFPDKACSKFKGVFRILGEEMDVHEDPGVVQWWDQTGCSSWRAGKDKNEGTPQGMCLVTGQVGSIARLHEPKIKGVVGAKSSGAMLVSYNCDSFESYGKKQGVNAPVSEAVAFGYCNALNYLLSREESRMRLPGATVVFWTDAPPERREEGEALVGAAFNPPPPAEVDGVRARIHDRLEELARGKLPEDFLQDADGVRFFILALSPNDSRLSVRFFFESTLGEFLRRVSKHYQDLRIQRQYDEDSDVISPYAILKETAREAADIPPLFAGALMRSILTGAPYPDAIALAILRRFRVNRNRNRNVTRNGCAFLKAWLIRRKNLFHPQVMLDTNNCQPGYVLGRLFAVLQKTQTDALGKNINRTIQDTYYSSASSTPRFVFLRLMRLYRHHLAKLSHDGAKLERERLVQEVMSLLSEFPAHLTLEQQGFFALGFYHQTQDFYSPKKQPTND